MIVNILIALTMIGHNISASLFNVQTLCCATYLDHPIVTSVTIVRLTASHAGILARYIADSIIDISRTGSKTWGNRK